MPDPIQAALLIAVVQSLALLAILLVPDTLRAIKIAIVIVLISTAGVALYLYTYLIGQTL